MDPKDGTRAKPGPKPKVGAKEREQVLGALGVGASIADAAALIRVDYKTLYRAIKADAEFAKGVKRAVISGKLRLIRKVANASPWHAAAWMLERRWGKQFGRKDTRTVKHDGPVQFERIDLSKLNAEDLNHLRDLRRKMQPGAN